MKQEFSQRPLISDPTPYAKLIYKTLKKNKNEKVGNAKPNYNPQLGSPL